MDERRIYDGIKNFFELESPNHFFSKVPLERQREADTVVKGDLSFDQIMINPSPNKLRQDVIGILRDMRYRVLASGCTPDDYDLGVEIFNDGDRAIIFRADPKRFRRQRLAPLNDTSALAALPYQQEMIDSEADKVGVSINPRRAGKSSMINSIVSAAQADSKEKSEKLASELVAGVRTGKTLAEIFADMDPEEVGLDVDKVLKSIKDKGLEEFSGTGSEKSDDSVYNKPRGTERGESSTINPGRRKILL